MELGIYATRLRKIGCSSAIETEEMKPIRRGFQDLMAKQVVHYTAISHWC